MIDINKLAALYVAADTDTTAADEYRMAVDEALPELLAEVRDLRAGRERLLTARPYSEHDGETTALWWLMPIDEPPYVGDPTCSNWPFGPEHYEKYLFWTPLPDCNAIQDLFDAARRRT